ncbi:MAG TPA: XrtA system polysaccharide chain length determinant [Candidatus Sulfotelmatobacter sp.]|nr:XrtA system polysaccharide chain length determinant [Candidatus Sulfotelmatobacter sp.]
MTQDFEEQSPAGFDLGRILGIARRRYFQFLIPLFVGWLAVWGASWFLPPRYKSGTLILVEQQTMPKDYVTPNVSDDLQERLQSITQQILSRTRLLHIIDEFNLYSSSHDHLDQDGKVDCMRKDIDITLVRDGSDRVTAFNVYYSAAAPYTAQQVTSELTNLFINENLEVRQQESEGTTKFLADQLEDARKNLADQEEKVRVFKSQHMGDLPGQLGANLQILSGLQSQLQAETDALTTANQQHTYLQTLFDQYRALQASPKSADGAPLGLPAIDDELEKLKAELADLSSRYTDRHPDVRKLKEQIAKTEKMRQQILADIKARSAVAQSDNSNAQSAASDLLTANGTPSPLAQIKSELQANELEISNRNHAIAELKNKINDYQARLNEEPIREQQLADLTRGYDQSKAIYDDLLKKKNDSQMATDMELLQQGERFRVLDPPSLPSKPDFPNHLKFCGFGLGAGLALGVGMVGAFEMLDDRLYSEKEIKELISVPIISEIPVIINPSDEKNAKKQIWLGWATGAVVFVIILAGSAFSYLHG